MNEILMNQDFSETMYLQIAKESVIYGLPEVSWFVVERWLKAETEIREESRKRHKLHKQSLCRYDHEIEMGMSQIYRDNGDSEEKSLFSEIPI